MICRGLSNRGRIRNILLATVLVFTIAILAPVCSNADDVILPGKGTPEEPFEVTTAEQLNEVRYHLDSHFIQKADIDLGAAPYNTGEGWTPIGNSSTPFTGTFNGNGKTIKNLYINRKSASSIGLFGRIATTAQIKNVKLSRVEVYGQTYVGAIVGGVEGGTITNCCASGTVIAVNIGAGGLAGYSKGNIEGSYSMGYVSSNSTAGGLVGYRLGGSIRQSYTVSRVEGNSQIGGLVGSYSGDTPNAIIEFSYVAGTVKGNERTGVLIGFHDTVTPTVSNCYWDRDKTGFDSSSYGGVGKSTVEMKQAVTYTTWDSQYIWSINADINLGYPYLKDNLPDPEAVAVYAAIADLSWESIKGENTTQGHITGNLTSDLPLTGSNGTSIVWSVNPEGWINIDTGAVTRPSSVHGNQPVVLRAAVTKGAYSDTKDFALNIDHIPVTAPPSASLSAGTFIQPQTTALNSATEGATIYYTTDGSEPTTDSSIYTSEIEINHTMTLKAIAVKEGMENSPVTSVYYELFAGGDGSQSNPYQVATAVMLDSMRNHLDKHFIQTADIDLGVAPYNTGAGWMPIGNTGSVFNGSFNGNGKTIKNLYINSTSDDCGLFGYSTQIENVRLENVNVVSTGDYVGGLVGKNPGMVRYSYVTGYVQGRNRVGGLVGSNHGDLNQSYSLADVKGNDIVGGLAGYNSCNILNSYARGDVEGISNTGGLLGYWNGDNTIRYVYSAGAVSGTTNVGGLIGAIEKSATIQDGYWDKITSGIVTSSQGIGKTTTEMKDKDTYQSWDYSVWGCDGIRNEGYPFLLGNMPDADAYAADVFALTDKSILGNNSSLGDIVTDLVNPLPTKGGNGSTIVWSSAPQGWINTTDGKVKRPTSAQGNQQVTMTATITKGSYSGSKSFELTIASPVTVATPVASIASGAYGGARSLTLTSATEGASVYYTMDGSTPTASSTKYTGAISINSRCTVKAIAVKDYMVDSQIATFTYTIFAGGEGSAVSPFQINTPDQLNYIRYYSGNYFILVADIDLNVAPYNTGKGWEPIASFGGVLDGNDRTISNLYINRPDQRYVGFISVISSGAQIKNMKLKDVNIYAEDYSGGLAAKTQMEINISKSISNVSITGKVETRYAEVGGLLGSGWAIEIRNSYVDCEIICGGADLSGISSAGGIAGSLSKSRITNSYVSGSVSAPQKQVGGLAGGIYYETIIENCYANCTVSGNGEVGGLIGYINTNDGCVVTSSYWDKEVSGILSSAGGEGKTTAEMKLQETYEGWNFTNLWSINGSVNGGYPFMNPDALAVSAAKDALTWEAIRGGNITQDSIRDDLANPLPTAGASGTGITWSLDPTSTVIDTVTGEVTRFNAGKPDKEITLIAMIEKNGISVTKEFHLIIKSYGNNALLSDLRINGTQVAGFASNKYTYSVELPYGTVAGSPAAAVTAATQDDRAVPAITQAAELPGQAKVEVTAEDNVTRQDYTINFTLQAAPNNVPKRKDGVPSTSGASVTVNTVYNLDLSTIFEDTDNDTLTCKVSVNGAAAVSAETSYTYTPTTAGTTILVFTANDGKADSTDTYTVTLTAATPPPPSGPVPPAISMQPDGRTVAEGDTVQFTVAVTGDEPLSYQWKKNGEPLSNDARISGVNSVTLTITNTQASDEGSYTCYVSNEAGDVSTQAAELQVEANQPVNNVPKRKMSVPSTSGASVTVNTVYNLDLSTIFEDADNDTLTCKVSINGEAAVSAEISYTYTPTTAGTTILVFIANDGKADSTDTYTVTLTASNPQIVPNALIITAGVGGSITTASGESYLPGAVVDIAAAANAGYSFNSWSSSDGGSFGNASSAVTTFTMPSNPVTITASFKLNDTGDSGGGGFNNGGIGSGSAPITNKNPNEITVPVETLMKGTGNPTQLSTEFATVLLPSNMITSEMAKNKSMVTIAVRKSDTSKLSEEILMQLGDRPVIELIFKLDGEVAEWNNPNSPVTVSVPYKPASKELERPEHITIWYIDGSGRVVPVTNGRYDAVSGTVIFTTTHFSMYAVVYVQKTFTDTDKAAWAKKAIEVMASKGVMEGRTDKEFDPQSGITRAEFMAALVRTLGVTAGIDGSFSDVEAGSKYYSEIAMAKSLGIANGVGDNCFKPDNALTRQDMMVLTERTLRTMKKLGITGTAADLEKYSDRAKIRDYAVASIAALVKEGLIEGNNGRLNTGADTTRAEAAVFLYRIYMKY